MTSLPPQQQQFFFQQLKHRWFVVVAVADLLETAQLQKFCTRCLISSAKSCALFCGGCFCFLSLINWKVMSWFFFFISSLLALSLSLITLCWTLHTHTHITINYTNLHMYGLWQSKHKLIYTAFGKRYFKNVHYFTQGKHQAVNSTALQTTEKRILIVKKKKRISRQKRRHKVQWQLSSTTWKWTDGGKEFTSSKRIKKWSSLKD